MPAWTLLLIPALPALVSALLALFKGALGYRTLTTIACLGVFLPFALSLLHAMGLPAPAALASGGHGGAAKALGQGAEALNGAAGLFFKTGPWIETQAFSAALAFRLDWLSSSMCLLIAGFGFLITLYSVGYMAGDEAERPGETGRFFAALNLFVASMLVLVLSDNLVLIFLGWEGVGLCSYLLIGHYWRESHVPVAAFRAFFLNRIGDVFFLLGVFVFFRAFGTVSLSELSQVQGGNLDAWNLRMVGLGSLLLLGGAFAKSAQVPLHVWLADAMAGPTPVSALIHAATMVTAGIYLLARLDWAYALAPEARMVIALCGLLTLGIGALMALTQYDIKKVLAYSTLANLALMFLAHAAGAAGAALMHLFGHAAFKALLFLAAGSVIVAAHHEQDLRNLKGVLRRLPVTRAAFIAGAIGGAGLLPFVSAGFFSKELVLESLREARLEAFGFSLPGSVFYGLATALEMLAALYLGRLLGYLFARDGASANGGRAHRDGPAAHGAPGTDHAHAAHGTGSAHATHAAHGDSHPIAERGLVIRLVLLVLIGVQVLFGFLSATPSFGGGNWLYPFLTAGRAAPHGPHLAHALLFTALNIALFAAAFTVYSRGNLRAAVSSRLTPVTAAGAGPFARRFYFDDVYDYLVAKPLLFLGFLFRIAAETAFIGFSTLLGFLARAASQGLKHWQNGKVHQYAMAVLLGTAFLAWVLLWS